jgi:hypothetical protein
MMMYLVAVNKQTLNSKIIDSKGIYTNHRVVLVSTGTVERLNLASQGLLLPHGATAKTLVPSGHVNPQILGVIRMAASLPFREEW